MTGTLIVAGEFLGTLIALTADELEAHRRRANDLGFGQPLGSTANAAPAQPGMAERWLDSRELAALTGIGDTWWEGAAKRGEVPHLRAGKYLRFRLSEVSEILHSRHADPRTAAHPEVPELADRLSRRNRKATP
jgi:predicted DNA-binding transcriptional regulator AlpA